jgi:hypothetical protein
MDVSRQVSAKALLESLKLSVYIGYDGSKSTFEKGDAMSDGATVGSCPGQIEAATIYRVFSHSKKLRCPLGTIFTENQIDLQTECGRISNIT